MHSMHDVWLHPFSSFPFFPHFSYLVAVYDASGAALFVRPPMRVLFENFAGSLFVPFGWHKLYKMWEFT